tara:strand:+ start:2807 stop:3055 length:249 start_codon:yes stop_codon:yes gene_type:complete
MTEIAYPRRTLQSLSPFREIIAVEPHMTAIPAYSDKPTMTLDEMRTHAKKNGGGTIMQQDDSMLPPFVLTKYDAEGNVASVS